MKRCGKPASHAPAAGGNALRKRILKECIAGAAVAELLKEGRMESGLNIDCECSACRAERDFEHWGAQYWTAQVSERMDEA